MSAEYVLKIDSEKIREMPMVDLAYELLKTANTPFYYRDLMMEIAKLRGLSQEQITEVIAQLYTEINIDGRFACVGGNVWGLKRWYPVERSDEQMGGTKRPRIINDDDDEDDDDLYGEEEDVATGDEESYDLFDEDQDGVFEEGEEAAEADDEVVLEDDEEAEIDEELESEDEDDDFEADDEEAADDDNDEEDED
ncbi:DNA-directed RNA polymerase subunit delta [Cohnella sp. LGH]|uniref:Probable DNA-directed RNA polymerase subunit delta n=1 Tax=Cohnella phaseoli TaxID=456490 RepID=A0A3D9HTT1_9BACL|nr:MULTISPECIES: DNA-directed RNA polymerase subunit delta [Cohnella]QTH43455.1 DNA-directed RNA polymerase subunit delta [Cohnella sp. LGH]RED52922.1 DNA-directed RNA polymerase subunit delta [Cohnella phaseoli]